MKRLLNLGLACLCLLSATLAHAAWDAQWTKRAKISLNTATDGLALQAGVDAVPVLIRLHTGNFQFLDAKPDGTDLRFIAADDKTPLKYHVEKFDGLNELALIWVQLPKLLPGSKGDFIWVYYGNPKAVAGDDSRATFDPAQALVYHFREGEAAPQDATANANHALRSSVRIGGSGLIGGGAVFEGKSELVLPATPSLAASTDGFTLSMWLKPSEAVPLNAMLVSRKDANAQISLALADGKLIAQIGATVTPPSGTIAPAVWQHVALVVKDGITLYVGGQEVARIPGPTLALSGETTIGAGFSGEIDELQVAATARSADWIRVAALSQGQEQRLVSYGPAEGGGAGSDEASHMRILFGALTVDGWVVVGICILMSIISIWVMIDKAMFVQRASKENDRFKTSFEKLIAAIQPSGDDARARQAEKEAEARFRNSQLFRLYAAGVHELRGRFASYAKAGKAPILSSASLEAIRATVDARLVRETQRLNSRMVLLTISIAGGPFLGLLGTVVGVMITFAAIAAAGDVNVNAIAPGIAAALIATVAGLGVAIPALFGYNYLTGRVQAIVSDMHVFVDELVTRFAENHSE
jgi:biopolymer transport protein ExbB